MTEAFVNFHVNNGSGEVLARVKLIDTGVSFYYVSNTISTELIGAGADWIAVIEYTDSWEPYICLYKTNDLDYSDSNVWPDRAKPTGRALVSASMLVDLRAEVEANIPAPQPPTTYIQYRHFVSPRADVVYTMVDRDGVTYLLDTQVGDNGLDVSSTRVIATTAAISASWPAMWVENGEAYISDFGEVFRHYRASGGQIVAVDHTNSSFSLAFAPRPPSFNGASISPDDFWRVSNATPLINHKNSVFIYGGQQLGDYFLLINNTLLRLIPPPYVQALTPMYAYPVGGEQVQTPTGFWVDLVNATQTTNAVIEFIPLQTITVEDVAEMRVVLECEGRGGKTSIDTANTRLALRMFALDAVEAADFADMGVYLYPRASEGYVVADSAHVRFYLRAEGQSDFAAGLVDPELPDIGVCYFHLLQDKHLDSYHSADTPFLNFDVSMFAISSTPGITPDFCDMKVRLETPNVFSRPWPPGATFRMHIGALHTHGWAGVPYEMSSDKVEFDDASATDQSTDIRSTVTLEAYARGRERVGIATSDKALFDDRLDGVYAELTASKVSLRDETLGDLLTTVYDRLLLTGQASSAAEARALVSSALALLAVADITPAETPTDQVTLSTAAREAVLLGGETFDRLVLRDLLPHSLVLAAAVRDTVRMDDEAALRAEINQRLADGLGLVAHLRLDNGHYTAWAMNTDSRATTRYQNYGFNSFMRVGGREYGASDAGLYRLEGDSDAGAPIQSHIRLGMSSLGSRLVKHVPDVYLGYSASGDLLLKAVISDSATGKREANVYRLVARGAASTREGRVKLGRGLNAVYWDFVIENVDGADFALDAIEFMPLAINRRLRGNAGAR